MTFARHGARRYGRERQNGAEPCHKRNVVVGPFASVTDEACGFSVQGEVARFVAPVRVSAPPALQRL
jgi:hypothetical protein